MNDFTNEELEAYLDEALAPEEMTRIEAAVRKDNKLLHRLSSVNRRRDLGVHSLGEVWRRHRLSCPPRHQLGAYLLDALDSETANYIYFHVSEVGCRYCLANVEDLKTEKQQQEAVVQSRQRRYFESSAGYLRK